MTLAALIERSRKDKESWRYTDLNAILAAPVSLPSAPVAAGTDASSAICLVFHDGAWLPDQSYLDALPPDFMTGDATNGYSIAVHGQTCLVTQPVTLLFRGTTAKEVNIKLKIALGESGRLTLLEKHEGAAVTVLETDIALAAQAKLIHGKNLKGDAARVHIETTQAHLQHGAFYDAFTLIEGGKLTRCESDIWLEGEEAQASLAAMMLLAGQDHADVVTRLLHNAPYGVSRQTCKAVLTDRSRGVFQGKVRVAEGAQKTDAAQLSRALLLSDKAEMDAKPELEIYADDVKCSHGCAIGDLDSDALFYLQARGIPLRAARAMLIRAFMDDMLSHMAVETWLEAFKGDVERWLDENG